MAQVGVDITQFKRGLDEADARMNLSAVRFAQAGKQVERMTASAQNMQERAAANTAKANALLSEQERIQKEIEFSQRRASDIVKSASRISSQKAGAETQIKALKQSGAAYTNLTAQRAILTRAETAAASLAKKVADAQTKHAASSVLLATSLQKKEDAHAKAQVTHAQALTKAQQAHANEVIKQQNRVAQARKVYLSEYEKEEQKRDANIKKSAAKVSSLEGQYNVAHRRSDAMSEEVGARHGP
jgi:chromosome segregation ATPase